MPVSLGAVDLPFPAWIERKMHFLVPVPYCEGAAASIPDEFGRLHVALSAAAQPPPKPKRILSMPCCRSFVELRLSGSHPWKPSPIERS